MSPRVVLFLALLPALSHAAELKIYPPSIDLTGPTASQPLLVVLEEGGRAIADVTADAKLVLVGDAASLDIRTLRAKADGTATIAATYLGQTAKATVTVKRAKQASVPAFRTDIMPLLTRSGCNSGACHGALAGKGGLKLSLRGFDPDSDYFVLTRQAISRRVDTAEPAASLLVRKPTRAMRHAGGKRFEPESVEATTLTNWIEGGAPGLTATDLRPTRLEVYPPLARLKIGQSLGVLVRAVFTSGEVRDVTRLVRFGSSEEQVANIGDDGQVKIVGSGEAGITIGYEGMVSILPVSSPFVGRVDPATYSNSPTANYIDTQILKKLRDLNLPVSGQTGDGEFIRRLYLDLAGILPTPTEVAAFLADTSKDKRTKLVDALLERPEFVDYWAYKWSDLLLVSTRRLSQPAMWSFYRFVRQSVADNRPWDQFARDILLASGSTLQSGAANYFVLHKDVAELTESTSITFLGTSITCARCHNHPLEKWTQDQYWQLANLFSRVSIKNGDKPNESIVQQLASGDVLHPRKGFAMSPAPLDGKSISPDSPEDRRKLFADWLTSKGNPWFSRAIVNRVWKNFMGRGLVEAEDDLRETNPPSNPELFDALVGDFTEHQFDIKRLIRTIVLSAAYQRSSKAVAVDGANGGNEGDDRFYSRWLIRRLSGEVLLDALSSASGSPTTFDRIYTGVEGGTAQTTSYPMGTRAMQLPDSRVASRLLDAFGRPDRQATCACERTGDSTVTQALHQNNGQTLNDKLRSPTSRIDAFMKEKLSEDEIVKRTFMLALSRSPSPTELKRMTAVFADSDTPAQRREAIEDLFWSVLSTREFTFNH